MWRAFYYEGRIALRGATGKMNAENYTKILDGGLLRTVYEKKGYIGRLQQDKAPTYTAEYARFWLQENNAYVMHRPDCCPVLNTVGIVSGCISCKMWKDRKQYENEKAFCDAVFGLSIILSPESIQELQSSLSSRQASVLDGKGTMIDY